MFLFKRQSTQGFSECRLTHCSINNLPAAARVFNAETEPFLAIHLHLNLLTLTDARKERAAGFSVQK
jgi:hypothetical protein